MPTIKVTRILADAHWPGPGLEGDELADGNVAGAWVCTSRFDQPRDNALGIHGALDEAPTVWRVAEHVPVVAPAGGRVENARRWNGISGPGGSYGNVVILRHDDGESSLSAHLDRFAPRIEAWLAAGALPWEAPYLEEGELVGYMGNTGNVWPMPVDPADKISGKHLHSELRTRPELGSVLIDPATRLVLVDPFAQEEPAPVEIPDQEPRPEAETNPTPNTPLDLTLSAALDEALLARFLAQTMLDVPLPLDEALEALEREARELVRAYGTETGALLDEARVLASQIAILRSVAAGLEYVPTIARLRDEFGEQAGVLRLQHEYRLAAG